MEHQPTKVQIERRQRADKLLQRAKNGEVTSLDGINPSDTSAETVHQVRRILQELGHIASQTGLNRL